MMSGFVYDLAIETLPKLPIIVDTMTKLLSTIKGGYFGRERDDVEELRTNAKELKESMKKFVWVGLALNHYSELKGISTDHTTKINLILKYSLPKLRDAAEEEENKGKNIETKREMKVMLDDRYEHVLSELSTKLRQHCESIASMSERDIGIMDMYVREIDRLLASGQAYLQNEQYLDLERILKELVRQLQGIMRVCSTNIIYISHRLITCGNQSD